MKLRFTPLLAIIFSSLLPATLSARPTVQNEARITAAYLLAMGRLPDNDELRASAGHDVGSVSAVVSQLKAQLAARDALQQTITQKAFEDSFGLAPLSGQASGSGTYAELVERNIHKLAHDSALYREVLDRAYRKVVRRPIYDEEIDYWKGRSVLPFALVVSCLDEWARRNQPGLMVTTGPATVSANCIYLQTVQLPPAIAEEARAAIGFPTATTSDFAYSDNRTVIAPGANRLLSNGRVQFVAAGASDLVN